MLKSVLSLLLLILAAGVPTLAQDNVPDADDPASYLPADTSLYQEIRMEENFDADLRQLVRLFASTTSVGDPESLATTITADMVFRPLLPDVEYETDILPWVGPRMGITQDFEVPNQYALVLPVDANGDQAALANLEARVVAEYGEGTPCLCLEHFTLYEHDIWNIIIAPNVVLVGPPSVIFNAVNVLHGAPSLAQDTVFNEVRAALPMTTAWGGSFLSSNWVSDQFGSPSILFVSDIVEFLLAASPSQAPIETALGEVGWYDGIGTTLELDPDQLTFTVVMIVSADYPAPTHQAELLQYVPSKSFLVVDSINVADNALTVNAVSELLIAPRIQVIFRNIASEMSSLPTPTPEPQPTMEMLLIQAQMMYSLVAAQFGLTTHELVETFGGEMLLAVYPAEGSAATIVPGMGAALLLQTDDPQQVMAALGTFLQQPELVLHAETFERRETVVDGLDVVMWSEGGDDVLAYGLLDENVVFVTTSNGISALAAGQSASLPALDAAAENGGETLLYLDFEGLLQAITPSNAGSQVTPFGSQQAAIELIARQFDTLTMTLDAQDDGLFVLRAELSLNGD